MKACKADWYNNQNLLKQKSYKEPSLKHLNNFGIYTTLPYRPPNGLEVYITR